MSNDEIDERIHYKIILVGDSLSKKTKFYKKLKAGFFLEKTISTIGLDRQNFSFLIKDCEGRDIYIDTTIYDTAGQERYRTITCSYFRGSQGIILFYSIAFRETFDGIKKWLEIIKETLSDNKNYVIFLMGMFKSCSLLDENKRAVTTEEAFNFCKDNDIHWCGECFYKDISQGELSTNLQYNVVQQIYNLIGTSHRCEKKIQLFLKDKKKKKSKSNCK